MTVPQELGWLAVQLPERWSLSVRLRCGYWPTPRVRTSCVACISKHRPRPRPYRHKALQGLGSPPCRCPPRGGLDPDLHPEAPRRALARGTGPRKLQPRVPLDAGEGLRQAPSALVVGDRLLQDRKKLLPRPRARALKPVTMASGAASPSRLSPLACRCRPPPRFSGTPTSKPQRSKIRPLPSERGTVWPGYGRGRRTPENCESVDLREGA